MPAESKIAKLFVDLGFKDDDFKKGLKGAAADLNRFGSQLGKIGKQIDRTVVRGFQMATASAVAFGASVVVTGARFEQSMATVQAITGQTGKELDMLSDKARDLGATTTFSATQAADAMQELARAGLKTNEIIGASGPALQFAGAMGAEMAQSTKMLASSMAQFGLNAGESERIVDTFTAAINNSLLDITKLQEAMKYAGTAGSAFGMSIEETTAAVGMFANLGLEGSQAGMNFRMAMIAAGKATKKKEAIMSKLGMTMSDINPSLHSFEEIMRTVAESGMSAGEAIEIFGARSGANVLKISEEVGNSSANWTKLNAAIADSAGVTEDTYNTMTNTVQGQFTILKSTIQETQLALFDGLQEGITELLMAWIEVFQLIGAVLGDSTSTITQDWNSTMVGMADSIRANKAEIAGQIIDMIRFFGDLTEIIGSLITKIELFAKILVTAFVARKAFQFAAVITGTVIPALTSATTAAGAFSAAINSATLGIPLLVSGLAAGVTALFMFGGGMSQAEKDAAAMQQRLEMLAEAERRYREGLIENLEEGADHQRTFLHNLELELDLVGRTGKVVQRELEDLRNKSADQIADMLATGEAVRVSLEGQQAGIMSTATLVRLAADEQLDANGEFQEALESAGDFNAQIAEEQAARIENIRAEMDRLRVAAQETRQVQMEARSGGLGGQDLTSMNQTVTVKTEGARQAQRELDSYARILPVAEQALERLTATQQGFESAVDGTAQALQREEAELQKIEKQRAAEERRRSSEDLMKEREAAAEASLKLLRASLDAAMKAAGEEEQLEREKLRRRIEEINETFAEEAALYRGNADKIAEIEENRRQAVLATNRAFYGEYLTNATEALEAAQDAHEQSEMNEIQILRSRQAEELEEFQQGRQRMLDALADNEEEKQAAIEQFNQQETQLRRAHQLEIGTEQAKINRAAITQIAADTAALNREKIGTLKALQEEENQAIADAVKEGAQVEQQIRDLFALKRERAVRDINDTILELTDQRAFRVLQLERERDALLLDMTEHTAEQREAVVEAYEKKIREAMNETSGAFSDDGETLMEFAKRMAREGIASLKDGFSELAGSAQNAGAGVAAVFDKLDKNKKLDKLKDKLKKLFENVKTSKFAKKIKAMRKRVKEFVKKSGKNFKEWSKKIGESKFGQGLKKGFGVAAGAARGLAKVGKGVAKVYTSAGAVILKGMKIAAAGVKLATQAAKKLGDMFGRALDTVAAISGFQFNLVDAAGAVNDQMKERAALEAKLAEGGLTAEEMADIQGQLDSMPASAAEAASTFVDDLINSSVGMVQTFAEAAPVLLQSLAEGIPRLIDALAENLPRIAEAIGEGIPAIVQAIADGLPVILQSLATSAEAIVGGIIEAIPMVIEAIGQALPSLIQTFAGLIVQLVEAIPMIVEKLLQALPGIIEALVSGLDQIIVAVVDMIPGLINTIVQNLPAVILALLDGMLTLVETLIYEIPRLIAAVIDGIPKVIKMVVNMIPDVIQTIVDALPGIVTAFTESFPEILVALIEMIPEIIVAIVAAIPEIVAALIFVLVPELLKAAGQMGIEIMQAFIQMFKDVITEIIGFIKHPFRASKRPKTKTFGDTPGVQKASEVGAMVQFAAGDFYAAAKKPEDLLSQVIDMVAGIQAPAVSTASGGSDAMLAGLGSALMSAADSMSMMASGGSENLVVQVTAEGRTLDEVLFVGGQRGHTPHLKRELRKTSGAHVGFDRGRYAPVS